MIYLVRCMGFLKLIYVIRTAFTSRIRCLLLSHLQRPITTLCWGHRDSRLFLACGPALYVVRVEHRVASLQLLCQQGIATAVKEEKDVAKLTMPSRLCSYVTTAFIPTIKVTPRGCPCTLAENVTFNIRDKSLTHCSYYLRTNCFGSVDGFQLSSQADKLLPFQPPIPDPNNMRDFVSYPTAGNERLHCTMKRTEDNPEIGSPCYTLYLEYLGGLVPILKGRRISKLRPEFVIMDPKTDGKTGKTQFRTLSLVERKH